MLRELASPPCSDAHASPAARIAPYQGACPTIAAVHAPDFTPHEEDHPPRRPDPGPRPRQPRGQPGQHRGARRPRPPSAARSWCCCRNCTTARTSASTSRSTNSISPSPFPARAPSGWAHWRSSMAWCWSARCSSSAPPGCTTTPRWSSTPTARTAGKYRKMHIPDDPGFYEKFYFTPGDLGFEPIETSVGRLGVLVCWDQWYPEGARLMALAGAELLLYPTAIGWDPDRRAGREGPPARCLGAQPPRPRRRQRPAGAELQPRRPRAVAAGRGRHRLLGHQPRAGSAGRVPGAGRRSPSRRS